MDEKRYLTGRCDPRCAGCIYSIATPLMFKDCEKCKSMLKEAPDKHGYFYFDKERGKQSIKGVNV